MRNQLSIMFCKTEDSSEQTSFRSSMGFLCLTMLARILLNICHSSGCMHDHAISHAPCTCLACCQLATMSHGNFIHVRKYPTGHWLKMSDIRVSLKHRTEEVVSPDLPKLMNSSICHNRIHMQKNILYVVVIVSVLRNTAKYSEVSTILKQRN